MTNLSKKVIHLVLIKFKELVTEQKKQEALKKIVSLQEKIDGLELIEFLSQSSHEGLNQGYEHLVRMVFTNEKCRDNYLPHPEHVKVVEQLSEVINLPEDVLAFDYIHP